MKFILRNFLATVFALYAAQTIIGGFHFGAQNIILGVVVVGLTLLNMFMIPIFKMISLPHKGLGYMILSFMLTLITLYVLTIFLSAFSLVEAYIPQLRISGFVLPSGHLTVFWSAVSSSFVMVVIVNFFVWLSKGR